MTRLLAGTYFTWIFVVTSLAVATAGPLEEGTTAFEGYDFTKAQQLLEPLAKDGNPKAQLILGHMSMNGWGVNQDYEAARKWYSMAAEQGNVEAQYLYAGMLHDAQGGPKDMPGMIRWTKLSASHGYNKAMSAMGHFYSNGVGVEQDFVQAYLWYSLALSHGLKDVEPYLELAANRLTVEQITEAQQLVRQWKPANN